MLLLGCGAQELWWGCPFPLHHHRLPACQDDTGPGDGRHAQIKCVFVLLDHVPDLLRVAMHSC